jgi:hypothetical protein
MDRRIAMEPTSYIQRVVRLEWVGPLAFVRRHPGPPSVDLDLGTTWGPRGDQRISWRHGLGADVGMLYAYDPLWDEFAVLAPRVSRDVVLRAYRQAAANPRATTVEALAALTQRTGCRRMAPIEVPGLEPEL